MHSMIYHPRFGATVVDDAQRQTLSAEWAETPFTDTSSVTPTIVRFDDLPADAFHVEPVIATEHATEAVKPKRGRPAKHA